MQHECTRHTQDHPRMLWQLASNPSREVELKTMLNPNPTDKVLEHTQKYP